MFRFPSSLLKLALSGRLINKFAMKVYQESTGGSEDGFDLIQRRKKKRPCEANRKWYVGGDITSSLSAFSTATPAERKTYCRRPPGLNQPPVAVVTESPVGLRALS